MVVFGSLWPSLCTAAKRPPPGRECARQGPSSHPPPNREDETIQDTVDQAYGAVPRTPLTSSRTRAGPCVATERQFGFAALSTYTAGAGRGRCPVRPVHVRRRGCHRCSTASWWRRIKISAVFHAFSRRDSRSHAASRVIRRNTNRRHMTGDRDGQAATLLVRAVDGILGPHSLGARLVRQVQLEPIQAVHNSRNHLLDFWFKRNVGS